MDSRKDPGVGGAGGRSSDLGAEVALVAAGASQVLRYLREGQDGLLAKLGDRYGGRIRDGTFAAARHWQPALDAGWLGQADLSSVIHAWGAATLFADPRDVWHVDAA